MNPEISVTTERIDDFPLLLAVMMQLGLPEILDQRLTRHGSHQGLSWGWLAAIWLAHILTESNHRKLPVQAWVRQAHDTIERITGMPVTELDFTDDRLTALLRRLSQPAIWQAIETDLSRNLLRVYDLSPQKVRLDATTVSGYHAGGEDSLFEFGHSKDDPTLRQVKVMVAALDPLGLPLVSQVVAGSTADDPLYRPAVERVLQIIEDKELLFVGDSKMSALATRAHIHSLNQHYLCPLALTGKAAEDMSGWIEAANQGDYPLHPIYRENARGERQQLAAGYVFERTMSAEDLSDSQLPGQKARQEWTEQVFVVCSDSYRQAQLKGLDGRLQRATDKLLALTPPPARGKRQFRDESELTKAADAILKAHAVEGLLTYSFDRQEKRQTKYLGRGRGNAQRPTHELVTVRYQITAVRRQEEAITALQQTFGWRAYVTDAAADQLTLEQAVLTYRDEWLIEHGFHRLKGAPYLFTASPHPQGLTPAARVGARCALRH